MIKVKFSLHKVNFNQIRNYGMKTKHTPDTTIAQNSQRNKEGALLFCVCRMS